MISRSAFNALILAEDESLLEIDRKVLRRLGIARPLFFSSGRKALDHLATLAARAKCRAVGEDAGAAGVAPPADMLICHERLADMSGLQFLAYVRKTSDLARIPALLLVGDGKSVIARAAAACNSCAVLARPYTEDEARSALMIATLPESLHAPLVLPPSFGGGFGEKKRALGDRPTLSPLPLSAGKPVRQTPQPAPAANAETLFRAGFAALQNAEWGRAEALLLRSHALDPAHAETCLALSRATGEQAREEDSRVWLCRAGAAYLRANARVRAQELFTRLPRGKSGQVPLLREAGAALQAGEVRAAALMFMEAHVLDPVAPLHALISRACLFTPAPEEHMRGLVKALAEAGHASTAGRLHSRLLRNGEREEESEENGFLTRFPVLHDILSVAGHTFKTWRTAA